MRPRNEKVPRLRFEQKFHFRRWQVHSPGL